MSTAEGGLPFSAEAKARGYTLHSYSGGKESASYIKDGVYLTVWRSGKAELSITDGMILAKLDFSLPNKNFDAFENRMRGWRNAIDNMEGGGVLG